MLFQLRKKIINVCERLGCNGKHIFNEMSYGNLQEEVERLFFLDRKQLNEYWQCVLTEHWLICPEWCKKCRCCRELEVICEELKESWFFSPRADHNYSLCYEKFF